ncbi:MAG: UDP-N-acetylglucosamine 2-epimerase (non-hydrolyzing) [Thiotrichaceae bacterium IS1]|nr:MAG: UDP-N-acetylglucosamine 2-epimerase (non-hydrolyzing) [Thiotrichaceae bacterium IS1]
MALEVLHGKKVWVMVGTRPEVIKQLPIYWALVRKLGRDQVALVGTGQHKELLAQALAHFKVTADVNLDIMKPNQTLIEVSANILLKIGKLLTRHCPEWVIVQGDTTTAVIATLAAFYQKVKIAHNEAGLRTYDLANPFPEEANRRMISAIADLHFAPTELAAQALLRENVVKEKIWVTGNTGIDALFWTLENCQPTEKLHSLQERIGDLDWVFLTAHRRESQGEKILRWFEAMADFIRVHPDLALVYPVHPNQIANEAIHKFLVQSPRIFTISPLDYGSTCHLLNRSRFVITDSGGIQEEAVTLGLPVVICRETTERMEAIHTGLARLAGFDGNRINECMQWAYDRSQSLLKQRNTLFGDGRSAERIVERIRL